MINSFFSGRSGNAETNGTDPESRATAIIEIRRMDEIIETEGPELLQRFYQNLACELYNQRLQNYGHGLRAIEPGLQVFLNKIFITVPLFLEKNVPNLSSIIFKHFIDYCNLVLAMAIKEGIPIYGIADIGHDYIGSAYSTGTNRAPSKESLIMSDLLGIFTFDEIFPYGFGQKVIPPVSVSYFFGEDLIKTEKQLSEINEIGIFMPAGIEDYPATEVAILSNMLKETKIQGNAMFSCNWKGFFKNNTECLSMKEIIESLQELSEGDDENALLWKKLLTS